jgi:hypothetical protein
MYQTRLRRSQVGAIDWGGLLDTVIKTGGQYATQQQQLKAQQYATNQAFYQSQAAAAAAQAAAAQAGATRPGGISTQTLLIAGVAVVGAFLILRKRR